MKDYEHIRNQLGSFLHQDYDVDSGGVSEAIVASVAHSDPPRLVNELTELESESDEKIRDVLSDHDVLLWDHIAPKDLLITMKTLALLRLKTKKTET